MKRFEKELADLNAATERRRAKLMKKMANARAREAAAERDRIHREGGGQGRNLNPLGRYVNPLKNPNDSPPDWVIGVAIDSREGVKVNRVLKGKPAESAGMKDGDVILKCSGITLRNREALVKIIQTAQDQPLTLMVQRRKYADDGETVQSQEEIEFTVKAIKKETAKQSGAATPSPYGKFLLEHLYAGNSRPGAAQQALNQLHY